MMLLVLGHFRDGIHKVDGVGEVVELERAFDVLLLQFPFRDFLQADFCVTRFDQISHNGTTSNIPKPFCNGESSLFFSACIQGQRSRTLRRFFAASNTSTAHWRACFDMRDHSAITFSVASAASSAPFTKRNPLSRGRYFAAPVSSVMTGRPIARNAAARSLNHPVRQLTSTPLIAVNSPSALAKYRR